MRHIITAFMMSSILCLSAASAPTPAHPKSAANPSVQEAAPGPAAMKASVPMEIPPYVEKEPSPTRGIYAVWYKSPDLLSLPFVKGGQIMVQWADVERQEGQYDFSAIEKGLKAFHDAGRCATVQINGNRKPAWLFQKVPYHPEKLNVQVNDPQGTLMYWHPTFVKAYTEMLAAYAAFLKQTPSHDAVLGVRMNFNALGTEWRMPQRDKRALSQWIVPPGVEPGPEFQESFYTDYTQQVIVAHARSFPPEIKVFCRNGGDDTDKYASNLETGAFGLFHTGSTSNATGNLSTYLAFMKWCRSGKAPGYAESLADSWGHRPLRSEKYKFSPCQENYWRILLDMNVGISFIAVYGNDLEHGNEPEFKDAFEFGARYAGCHASPRQTPGVWIAFREGDNWTGDYTMLMKRLPDETIGKELVGDKDQRFGGWARQLPAGKTIQVAMDPVFAQSVEGKKTIIKVTYFPESDGTLTVTTSDTKQSLPYAATHKWETKAIAIPRSSYKDLGGGAQIQLGTDKDMCFHMAEVARD
ncbi:MAG: beta-galactosidase [Candidatus Sumerlaeota bacterium]|nr:beta-galactosidase [Candidatus Sumerlaeota bacterium]